MLKKNHPAVAYCLAVASGQVEAPHFVKMQCEQWLQIARGHNDLYKINEERAQLIEKLLNLLIVPKGLAAGHTCKEAFVGFQWLFVIAVLCTVHRENPDKRKYETALLEICRKNGKTFLIAVLFILLFFLEPKFSKFYSVAPDGALSKELKNAIEEILKTSPATSGDYKGRLKFKIRRDDIYFAIKESDYIPLNYSNSNLDSRLPTAFLVDETGGLPNHYAIDAMQSGQLMIKNKLGCIISTKYPKINNPFEDEVEYCKKVLNKVVDDETLFALLYEPDNTKDWMTDDKILEQSNPLALEIPEVMQDIKQKRAKAIIKPENRENFVTKHCNIMYSGVGTETFVDVLDLQKGRLAKPINWQGRGVYVGVDLAMTNDNCAVVFLTWDDDLQGIIVKPIAFIPADRQLEKTKAERFDYMRSIQNHECIACGSRTVDYGVIEQYVFDLGKKFGVTILGNGFDRYNALSSAQKWEPQMPMIEIKQHSSVLHPATKWLAELIADGKVFYEPNKLFEENFQNARCTYDTNMNRYVNKKKSKGKIDEVAATINGTYLLHQDHVLHQSTNWTVQT